MEWLEDVPEHWELIRLKYVSPEITVGVVVNPSSYFVDEGVPILLGNNVLNRGRPLQNVQAINLMVCDFCYGELGKPDSPARKRFEDRFLPRP